MKTCFCIWIIEIPFHTHIDFNISLCKPKRVSQGNAKHRQNLEWPLNCYLVCFSTVTDRQTQSISTGGAKNCTFSPSVFNLTVIFVLYIAYSKSIKFALKYPGLTCDVHVHSFNYCQSVFELWSVKWQHQQAFMNIKIPQILNISKTYKSQIALTSNQIWKKITESTRKDLINNKKPMNE